MGLGMTGANVVYNEPIPVSLAFYAKDVASHTLFLKKINEPLFKILLGCMLIGYALYRLFLVPKPRSIGKAWGWAAGFATGAISAAFSAGGPPTIIYTTLTGWNKHEIKSTLSIFFFLGGVATATAANGLSPSRPTINVSTSPIMVCDR